MSKDPGIFISPLLACLLGMGLTTVWFQARKPTGSAQDDKRAAPSSMTAESSTQVGQPASTNQTSGPPWRKKVRSEIASEKESAPGESSTALDTSEILEVSVEIRHAQRMRNLALILTLGLDEYQAGRLRRRELVENIDPFGDRDQIQLEEILTPEQAAIYERLEGNNARDEAEWKAMLAVQKVSRAIDLSEEQREKLFKLETELGRGSAPELDPFMDLANDLFHQQLREILTEKQYKAYEALNEGSRQINQAFESEARTLGLFPSFP